jgi:hypothetical protein
MAVTQLLKANWLMKVLRMLIAFLDWWLNKEEKRVIRKRVRKYPLPNKDAAP